MLVPREPTEAMKREGVTKALSVSLGAGYTWPDYMADLWSTMLYASPQPEAYGVRAAVIEECIAAVEHARSGVIHNGNVAYISGVSKGHDRSIAAIRALSHTEQGEAVP
jgi:hypothetical protein